MGKTKRVDNKYSDKPKHSDRKKQQQKPIKKDKSSKYKERYDE